MLYPKYVRMLTTSKYLFLFSLLVLLCYACGAVGTTCQSDADCYNGSYCAPTDKQQKICIQRAETEAATETVGQDANTHPPENQNSSLDSQSNPPENQTHPPENQTNPPEDQTTDRSNPGADCKIPAYQEANDPGNGGQQVQLDDVDKAFFARLYEIYAVSQRCHEKVWGGKYQLHLIPTYMVNIGSNQAGNGSGIRGFLVNHPKPPAGSILVNSKQVYGIPNVYHYDAAMKGITPPGFDFGYSVGSVKVYAFEYGTGDDWINPLRGRDVFALFVHEAFHRIQDYEESWKYPNGNQNTTGYPITPEGMALALLTDQSLIAAVTGKVAAEDALKTYYAVRKERIRLDTSTQKLVQALDNFQEWLEGTAMYTETLYMNLLGLPLSDENPNSVPGRLVFFGKLRPQDTRQNLLDTMSARFYATGAAVGILLDQVGDNTWKEEIRKGRTFYDIVATRYSSLDATQLTQILEQAKQKYEYTNKLLPIGQEYAKKK